LGKNCQPIKITYVHKISISKFVNITASALRVDLSCTCLIGSRMDVRVLFYC
jgi:hypothetical protein